MLAKEEFDTLLEATKIQWRRAKDKEAFMQLKRTETVQGGIYNQMGFVMQRKMRAAGETGAGEEDRTPDVQLGKLTFCH